MFAVGLFVNDDPHTFFNLSGVVGLFNGGGFYSLGIQCLAIICIIAWTAATTFFVIGVSDLDILTLTLDRDFIFNLAPIVLCCIDFDSDPNFNFLEP